MIRADLHRLLPHRPPMLLVDEVVAVEPGVWLIARKTVSAGDPWCGSGGLAPYLVLESWLQACAALVCWDEPQPDASVGGGVLVAGLRDVWVGRPAFVGQTIEHRVEVVRSMAGSAICTGSAVIADETMLTVTQVTVGFTQGG
jgi:3-hydroxyacyl-[acyl-carrier-protein] dehydratase